jgi:hypothetical protein
MKCSGGTRASTRGRAPAILLGAREGSRRVVAAREDSIRRVLDTAEPENVPLHRTHPSFLMDAGRDDVAE